LSLRAGRTVAGGAMLPSAHGARKRPPLPGS